MKANGAIYVAGHRGLVGGAICRALQEQGYTNPITGTHGELDLTEQLQVRQFFAAKRPAYVVLAAPKGVEIPENTIYPAEFTRDNLLIQNHRVY